MRNEPTNPCEFAQFRLFVEAIVVGKPHVEVQDDGTPALTVSAGSRSLTLFNAAGTGIVLRSPHETIHYLGKIVKQTFLGADNGLLTITASDGADVPIFLVKRGKSNEKASAVTTRVDNEAYWIPAQSLSAVETHFSFAALGVVKDIISLNTSQSQLPVAPSRIVVN